MVGRLDNSLVSYNATVISSGAALRICVYVRGNTEWVVVVASILDSYIRYHSKTYIHR